MGDKEPTTAQLLKLIADQQVQMQRQGQQIQQLLQGMQNRGTGQQGTAPVALAPTIPALPDIQSFEPTEERSRITEWLERFKFALDCAAPAAEDKIKVKALMNKMSEAAYSEYRKSCLPGEVTDFTFNDSVARLEKLFAKPQSIFIDRYDCLSATR